jgi:hypothetical protein
MFEFILAAIISIFMVIITTIMFYEVLRISWAILPRLEMAPRKRIIVVMLSIFFGHTIAVWMYGISYWFIANFSDFGNIVGEVDGTVFSYVYFSAATYSSLGLGDVYPTGGLRLLTGVEVLNGLVLIGWSVSFTYLAMQKFWDLHQKKHSDKQNLL